MDITQYTDPKEYPDWRWTRVKGLLKEGETPGKYDDKYIHRAFRFAEAINSSNGSDTAMFNISMTHRDVSKAVGLQNNMSRRKHYIEALALCWDIDEPGIAKYMGESQVMVRYYLKLFFDIRDKLDSTGYVCSRIMEPALLQSIQDCKDPGIGWKIAGLFGGYDAVRACWESRESSPKVQNYFKKAGVTTLLRDFGVGTFLRPLNRFNIELVADHVLRLAELEIKAQAIGSARQLDDGRVDMLRDIMDSMKFFVVDPEHQTPLPARETRLYERLDQQLVAQAVGGDAGEQHE